MKRVLITGGSGFIGRNLTVYMQNMGYVVSAPGHQELDLLDIAIVGQYLKKGKYDVVIHAANTNMLNSNQYDILNTNLRMFYNLEKHQNMIE